MVSLYPRLHNGDSLDICPVLVLQKIPPTGERFVLGPLIAIRRHHRIREGMPPSQE